MSTSRFVLAQGTRRSLASVQLSLLVVLFILAAVASGCYPIEEQFVTPGPVVRITGMVVSVQNSGDAEGICHIRDEYWVLVTPASRYVVGSPRDPVYTETQSIGAVRRRLAQMVGRTVTVEGQVMSAQVPDSGIVCTWVRPTDIYD